MIFIGSFQSMSLFVGTYKMSAQEAIYHTHVEIRGQLSRIGSFLVPWSLRIEPRSLGLQNKMFTSKANSSAPQAEVKSEIGACT